MTEMNQLKEIMQKLKPVTSEEYLKDPAGAPVDSEGGLTILPEAGIVFKTKEAKTNIKFFINITSHPVIDKPDQRELVDMEVGRPHEERRGHPHPDECRQHPGGLRPQ